MRSRAPLVVAVLALLTACGGRVVASGGSGGSTASTGGSGGGTSAVDCNAGVFPTFDKTCSTLTDCVLEFHQIDCCGTRIAIGMRASEAVPFVKAEDECESQYPGCGCAEQGTQAEDGKTALDDSAIQVACQSGQCSSFVP